MLTYAVRRLLGAIPTLFIIVTLAFVMVRSVPGGPFASERQVPPEVEANLERAYGLDQPLLVQYGNYLASLLQGDFGPSFKYKDLSVNELIRTGFPISLKVGGVAILAALLIGGTLGTYAALRQNSAADYGVMATAMTGIALPNFVVAPLLILVFAVYLGLLPAGGVGDGSYRYFVLPTVALALPQIAYVARLTRGSMIEVMRSNYIRTARAKGLPSRVTLLRHALRAALLPVVSYLGPAIAAIITGSVVIEQIFAIPGMGRYFVQGATNRDYTLVMGAVVFLAVLILVMNLLADILYGLLDPRVRYD